MDTRTLLLPVEPMPPFEDGVQASSVSKRQVYPGTVTTAYGLLLPGNAVHASRGDKLSLRTSSAPELLRGADQVPAGKDPTAVSTGTTTSSGVTVGSACGSPESAAELSRTIARLRVTVNALTASSSALFPAIVPELCAINAVLDIAASHDLEASSPKQRSEFRCTLTQLSNQLGCLASALSCFSPAVRSPPAACELQEFNGFEEDADNWVATVNALGARMAWTEEQKWCVAIDRLRNGAAAWHRYEGVRQQSWAEWSTKLKAAFGPINYNLAATTQSNLTATEDGAQEGHHLEAATVHCSSPADNVTTCPGTRTHLRPDSPLQATELASVTNTTSLTDAATTSRSQPLEKRSRSSPSYQRITTTSFHQRQSEKRPSHHAQPDLSAHSGKEVLLVASKHGPLLSTHLLAECDDAQLLLSDKSLHEVKATGDATIVKGQSVSASGHPSMAESTPQPEADVRQHCPRTCDKNHFIQTATVLPEGHVEHNAVVFCTGSVAGRPGSDKCGGSGCEMEMPLDTRDNLGAGCRHVRPRSHPSSIHNVPTRNANQEENKVDHTCHRKWHAASTNVRPQRYSQGYRPEASSSAVWQARLPRVRDLRQLRISQCRSPESYLAKVQVKFQHCRARPLRNSQCRPPDILMADSQAKSQRGQDRPPRCSQHRPPETLPAAQPTMLAVMAECDDEDRHRGPGARGARTK